MKRKLRLLTLMATLFSIGVHAQIKKGSVLLGGGISGGTSKNEFPGGSEAKTNSFSFSPSLGFVVKDNRVLGFNLYYNHSKQNSLSNSNTANSYGIGVFARRYHNLSPKFYLFGEAGLGYNYGKSKTTQGSSSTISSTAKTNSAGLYAYPGLAFAVSKRFHLEASLNNLLGINYSRTKTTNYNGPIANSETDTNLGFSASLSNAAPLMIGFRFVLGK